MRLIIPKSTQHPTNKKPTNVGKCGQSSNKKPHESVKSGQVLGLSVFFIYFLFLPNDTTNEVPASNPNFLVSANARLGISFDRFPNFFHSFNRLRNSAFRAWYGVPGESTHFAEIAIVKVIAPT